MDSFLIGLLSAMVATNPPAAISNFVFRQTGASLEICDSNSPVEQEFQKLMEEDDAAQDEVDKWIRDNEKFAEKGAGTPTTELNQRILTRLEPVRSGYKDFIAKHPDFVRARIAYASFLDDIGDEEGSYEQLDKAIKLDPNNPAVLNNIANYYGHNGSVKKAFGCYAKAIELNSKEPIYYHNFGTTVFLFRKDAMEFYGINEQQVFDKALDLYSHATKLAPNDFPLATDVAQTFYGIKPMRTNDALQAWTNALNIAHNDIEREGTQIHLARTKMMAGRYDEAIAHLKLVANERFADLKRRVMDAVERHVAEAKQTNAPTEKLPSP